jgi:hypothetical protein
MAHRYAIGVAAVLAVSFLLAAGAVLRIPAKAADGNQEDQLKDRAKAVQQTLEKSDALAQIRAANAGTSPYYGKIRMVAASSDNTNTCTFWVYGNPPPYKAYTIDFSQASAQTMFQTVLFAASKDAQVGVYSGGTPERPTFVVVYP